MRSRSLAFLTTALLAATISQALAANQVKLAHTFRSGDVFRYKVGVNIAIGGGSISSTDGVLAMRTVRILPNGDAHLSISYESGKVSSMGTTYPIPTDHPALEFDMSANGTIREVEKIADNEATKFKHTTKVDGAESESATVDIYTPILLALYSAFPQRTIAPGESWRALLPAKGQPPFAVRSKLIGTKVEPSAGLIATIKSTQDMAAMKPSKSAKLAQSIVSRFAVAPGHLVSYDQTMSVTGSGMAFKIVVKLNLLR